MSRKIVDAWFDAFRDKDISKLGLAEDFVHASPFGEIRGRKAYLDLVRANSDAFFGPQINILDVIEGGDRFAVRYLVDGNTACDCIYVRGGQIAAIYSSRWIKFSGPKARGSNSSKPTAMTPTLASRT